MKDADWDECVDNLNASARTPDKAKANSLITTAKDRIRFLRTVRTDDSNAKFIFEAYYSSLLEALHALVLTEGFKVGNHVCRGYYLRDVLKRQDLYGIFDTCRKDRNALLYYGSKIEPDTAKANIKRVEKLTAEILKMLSG